MSFCPPQGTGIVRFACPSKALINCICAACGYTELGMFEEANAELEEIAYATRRGESIHAAHAILTRAAGVHPTDPTIQFNLACYEAQMGSLDRAKAHLRRATEINAKFKLLALEDPDLQPLWVSLSTD